MQNVSLPYSNYIDYALLKPTITPDEIKKGCAEAIKYKFTSVCVPPTYVRLAVRELENTSVKVGTVIGFPLGYVTSKTKAYEAQKAVEEGAKELDILIQIGLAKAGYYEKVAAEITDIAKRFYKNITLKAILELGYFSLAEKQKLILALKSTPVHFLKTGTGFGPEGATLEDIHLMKRLLKGEKEIKAAGGIKDAATFLAMLKAGATRIGTSSGIAIIQELCKKS
ncbi:MAG: deoxyribose-phosphate aldolase [Candidatus Desulfofervidaceae bacterium]|nr:deoxyribose-phosphate aldolase [Candidatus Desulfofervidaceae bacterium]